MIIDHQENPKNVLIAKVHHHQAIQTQKMSKKTYTDADLNIKQIRIAKNINCQMNNLIFII